MDICVGGGLYFGKKAHRMDRLFRWFCDAIGFYAACKGTSNNTYDINVSYAVVLLYIRIFIYRE